MRDGKLQRAGLTRRVVLRQAAVWAAIPAAITLGAGPAVAEQHTSVRAPAVAPVEVTAQSIPYFRRDSRERDFGRLRYLGGLHLTSEDERFGGFSGLIVEPDGKRFLSITDDGNWLSGRFVYDGDRIAEIASASMGPLLARSGRLLRGKRERDSEALALVEGNLSNGQVLIGFERLHRIGRYPIRNGVPGAPTEFLSLPPDASRMSSNRGFEAVAVLRGGPHSGAIIALSERFGGEDEPHRGWIWIDGRPSPFELENIGGHDITDSVSMDDGSLVILERRFRWSEGVRMQLRLIEGGAVRPGAKLSGEVLLSADMGYEVDNMEGIAFHRDQRGRAVLTVISDDNFNSFLQRTILLQFELRAG